MGTRLENKNGKNLYEFWGDRLSETLTSELGTHKDKVVINCASNEYFKSIDNEALGVSVFTPEFKEIKNGKTRMISFCEKGERYDGEIHVENRIDLVNKLILIYCKFDQSLSVRENQCSLVFAIDQAYYFY